MPYGPNPMDIEVHEDASADAVSASPFSAAVAPADRKFACRQMRSVPETDASFGKEHARSGGRRRSVAERAWHSQCSPSQLREVIFTGEQVDGSCSCSTISARPRWRLRPRISRPAGCTLQRSLAPQASEQITDRVILPHYRRRRRQAYRQGMGCPDPRYPPTLRLQTREH